MKARLVTGFVAGPLLIAILAAPGGWAFVAVVAVAAVIAVSEAHCILRQGLMKESRPLALLLSLVYVCFPLACIVVLRMLPQAHWGSGAGGPWQRFLWRLDPGVWRVALVLLTTWSGDTAAYFAGRAFGKHKMAPNVSPGKTWEGSAANFVACVGVASLLSLAFRLPPGFGLACGALIGVLGQAGDLLESKMKRAAGVKDSGNLLPGHGGMLDRIDSLLLPAPFILLAYLASNPVVIVIEEFSK